VPEHYAPTTDDLARLREHVIAERRAQGLPDHVEDDAALDRVAALFAGAEPGGASPR
jgi:hypothetical protein